jgi:hypothetical protein
MRQTIFVKTNSEQADSTRRGSLLPALLVLCLSLSGMGGHVHAMVAETDSGGREIHHNEMAGMSRHDGHEMLGAMMAPTQADESCCQDQASCHCSAIPQFLGASDDMPPRHSVTPLRSLKVLDFIFDIVPPPPKPA